MKKILSANIVENVRRQPFNKASLEHIQEAFTEVFADIMKGITDSSSGLIVLHGCVDSDAGATAWNISAGAIMYNGEIYKIDAFVGTHGSQVPVLSVVTSYRAGDPVKFSDNNDYNVHAIYKLQWALGVSGSGLADFSQVKRLRDTINPGSVKAVNDGPILLPKVIPIGPWNMNTDPFATVAHGIPDHKKIRDVKVIIRNDADTLYYDLYAGLYPGGEGDGRVAGAIVNISATEFELVRTEDTGGADTGIFAVGDFDNVSGSFNRGWITVWYEA